MGTPAATATDPEPREPAGAATPTTRATCFDLLVVGVAALVVRIPAYLSARSLVFDDGVFGASVVAMRAGGLPFRDVFSSQGPLFLPLAWLGDLAALRSADSPRTIAVVSGVAIAIATYAAGREVTNRPRALLAAGLVIVSGSVLWTTGPLAADGPASAFAVLAVAAALGYRRAPSTARAVAIGLLAGAAFSVKSLLVLPALLTVGVVVLSRGHERRRYADIVAVPAVAAAVVILVSLPWGLARVLEQSVLYHTDAITDRAPLDNLEVVARTLLARDLPLVVAGVVAVAAWLWHRSRHDGRTRRGDPQNVVAPPTRAAPWIERLGAGRVPLVVWVILVAGVLLTESPMWRSHVAHLVPPLALLISSARVSWRTIAVAAALALPVWVVSLHPLLWPEAPGRAEATVARAIRSLPPGALVISDTPGVVWRAGRRTPDRYVDTSILRITSPRADLRITEDDIVRDAASPRVCGVVRGSRKRFGRFPDLGPRLRREGYQRRFPRLPAPAALWLKAPCRPRGAPPSARPADPTRRTSGAAAPGRSPG